MAVAAKAAPRARRKLGRGHWVAGQGCGRLSAIKGWVAQQERAIGGEGGGERAAVGAAATATGRSAARVAATAVA